MKILSLCGMMNPGRKFVKLSRRNEASKMNFQKVLVRTLNNF